MPFNIFIVEDDPIIGLFAGVSDLAENSEEILVEVAGGQKNNEENANSSLAA